MISAPQAKRRFARIRRLSMIHLEAPVSGATGALLCPCGKKCRLFGRIRLHHGGSSEQIVHANMVEIRQLHQHLNRKNQNSDFVLRIGPLPAGILSNRRAGRPEDRPPYGANEYIPFEKLFLTFIRLCGIFINALQRMRKN